MIRTTRAQREALFNVFKREFPNWVSPGKRREHSTNEIVKVPTIQYRRFLKKCQPELGGWGAIMVPYAGMWLGIEKDGHCHS